MAKEILPNAKGRLEMYKTISIMILICILRTDDKKMSPINLWFMNDDKIQKIYGLRMMTNKRPRYVYDLRQMTNKRLRRMSFYNGHFLCE